MSSVTSQIPEIGGVPNGGAVKPPKASKSKPVVEPEPERKVRKRLVRDKVNRSYYIASVDNLGTIDRMVRKFPTVGQARKHKKMVAEIAGIAESLCRVVRTVIVE